MKTTHSEMYWARDRREVAVEDLKDFEAGNRTPHEMRDGELVDVRAEWIDRLRQEIEALDRLISAG